MILSFQPYGDPQLSQQQQITHSNNKLIATTTKTSHQNQIAHSTYKMLTAQTKILTASPDRGGLLCLFPDLKRKRESPAHGISAEVLDFLTRVYFEKFRIRGVWKSIGFCMYSIKYLSGILILHFIYITITRSHVGKHKAIQHTTATICNKSPWGWGGGGQDYLPTTEKRTVIKIITKTKLLGQWQNRILKQ